MLHSSIASSTLEKLLKKGWPIGFISKMRGGMADYQVHILMLERYSKDWFKNPVRITESVGSPRRWYRNRKKKFCVA
jgi:hypothetical protein